MFSNRVIIFGLAIFAVTLLNACRLSELSARVEHAVVVFRDIVFCAAVLGGIIILLDSDDDRKQRAKKEDSSEKGGG